MLPLITLEEHFLSPSVRASYKQGDDPHDNFPEPMKAKLHSLDKERLQDMDNGNVSLQVISHSSTIGSPSPSICRTANDELHTAIQSHPTRFAGFAMLPMANAPAAVTELTRCVYELKFVGALVNNHINGQFYDDPSFWPIFSRAQELDVPLYLHPTFASSSMAPHSHGNYSSKIARDLSAYAWSWHSETGFHILRLFASGVFDTFPKLKIIIGHMGEMLPFMLDRIIGFTAQWEPHRERGLRQVWDENVWITTSGMFSVAPLACLLRATKMERILYSVDYPYSGNEKGKRFMEEIEESGLVGRNELEMIAWRNAENLLGVHLQQ
ncbi:MAG: hypothetical protein M1827_003260 [Pycnora praestabilis]|nr:MAG: hypothetical protein M1827_003260 [Pycnora praestabilis]